MKKLQKLKLYGFNNLTKNLNFCIYDINYTNSSIEKNKYINYIDKKYNSKRLIKILKKACYLIDAKILNISYHEYDPQGASAVFLISEKLINEKKNNNNINISNIILSHLNKSHICVHTYPESHPVKKISTFRVDIEISTCGIISPLKILNFFIKELESDIVTIDYRIRGFTRDINGKKYFTDHKIKSIQNFIHKNVKNMYDIFDTNIYHENIFHTRMMIKNIYLKNYIFNYKKKEINNYKKKKIIYLIWKEMREIFFNESN